MSETTTPESNESTESKGRCGHRAHGMHRRRRWRFWALLAMIGAGAVFIPRAFAHGGWGGHCGRGEVSQEDVQEHLGWATDRLLDEADATDAQRATIHKIADEAAPEIYGFKTEAHELGGSFHDALADADRESMEALRQDGLELVDRASARGVDWLARVAETLSPEQREKLRVAAEKHHK